MINREVKKTVIKKKRIVVKSGSIDVKQKQLTQQKWAFLEEQGEHLDQNIYIQVRRHTNRVCVIINRNEIRQLNLYKYIMRMEEKMAKTDIKLCTNKHEKYKKGSFDLDERITDIIENRNI